MEASESSNPSTNDVSLPRLSLKRHSLHPQTFRNPLARPQAAGLSSTPQETTPSQRFLGNKGDLTTSTVAIVIGIILAVVVVLLVFILALYLHHLYGARSGSNVHFLKNPDFHDTSLETGLNKSAEPCKDFYKFVCGKDELRPRRPHGYEWRLVESLNLTRAPSMQVSLKQKVDAFFQSCLRRNQPPREGFRSWFQNFIRGIFGKPSTHFMTALTNLSMYWRLHLMFEVSMEHNQTLILRQLNSRHWREQRTWLMSSGVYSQFVADALHLVLEGNYDKNSMLAKVIAFEDMLYKRFYVGPTRTLEDPFMSTSMRELSKLTPNISLKTWLTSLNTVLPVLTDSKSPVKVFSDKVIEIINMLTSMSEPTDVQPLIRWMIAKQLYSVQYKPLTPNQRELATQCLRLCAGGMGVAVVLPVLDDLFAGRITILGLAQRVLSRLANRVEGLMWMHAEDTARTLNTMMNTTYHLGLDLHYDKNAIDQLYSELPSLDSAFFDNWLHICKALRTFVGKSEGPWGRVLQKDSIYSIATRSIVLPLSRITRPEFNYTDTSMVEANILASHMAIMAMFVFGTAPLQDWEERTKREFEKQRRCIKVAFNISEKAIGEDIAFAYAAALGTAFDVSQELFLLRSPQRDSGVFDTKQLFFSWWCFETCGRSSRLCNVPLRNSPMFAHAFNCSEGSPMNPSTKCALW